MNQEQDYKPEAVVHAEGLSRKEWLDYRRQGIGGSDAAAVLGISPWRTARDLYYDKLNIATADDDENWVAKAVGQLLEPLVAKVFERQTGLRVHRMPYLFRHPHHPWMLADLDYLVDLPDGTNAILECKTTNHGAKELWWNNGAEAVPPYYRTQGCHYMAVVNLNRVYFCCLYGNTEEEVIIRRVDRDRAYEAELIAMEQDFWQTYVTTQTPPPYLEYSGELIQKSLRRAAGLGDGTAPPVTLGQRQAAQAAAYLELQARKCALAAQTKELDNEMKRLKGLIVDQMGDSREAAFDGPDGSYLVTCQPSYTVGIPKERLTRLKEQYPQVYQEFAVVTERRGFRIKKAAPLAA